MRRVLQLVWLFVGLLPAAASAQVVQRCKGEAFAELAAARLGDARLGPLVMRFNGAKEARCTKGRFVRFPAAIRHEVRLGQTLSAIASRFTRGAGGEALLRDKNGLPAGTEPNPGTVLQVPAELTLKLGSRPEQELRDIFGLPPIEEIRRYNGGLPKGGTVYVPLFFDLLPLGAGGAPPPVASTPSGSPPAPVASAPPPKVVDPATVPEAEPKPGPPPRPASSGQVGLSRVLQVASVARFDGFLHPIHEAVLQDGFQCGVCHLAEPRQPHTYQPVPEAVCTECHRGAQRTDPVLRSYRLGLSFSHDQHLSPTREAHEKGYELACATCHPAIEKSGQRENPGHPTCVKCHNPSEVKPLVESDCSSCHDAAESLDRPLMARALLAEHYRGSPRADDIAFGHDEHVGLFEGEEAGCDRCHAEARTADTLEVIEPERMSDCLACHQGLERELAGAAVRLDRCKTCHLSTRPELAPRMSSVIEKPLNHSATFRRRHASQATADDGVCASCHPELAGGAASNCNACHQQIRPQDHTVRWRGTPHGRAAERRPDRCATCHLEDRCADCHAQPPRDHFPRASFQLSHGRRARVSTRRCLTCHVPQVDCARCHDIGRL